MEAGAFSALCVEALDGWLENSDYRRYHSPYYAGQTTKRVGFRVSKALKLKAQKKAGWMHLGVVMSNLVKERLQPGNRGRY